MPKLAGALAGGAPPIPPALFRLVHAVLVAQEPGLPAPLRSTIRQRMVAIVAAQPGIPLTRAARVLGLSLATASYHVAILAGAQILAPHRAGRHLHLYAKPAAPATQRAVQLVSEPAVRAIAAFIIQHPGTNFSAIQDALGLTPRQAYHSLQRLREAGLIHNKSTRKYVALHATDALVEAIRG